MQNLRVAIIYYEKNIWVEFTPKVFRELLKKYYEEHLDLDKALDQVEKDIKEQVKKK